MVKLNRIPPIPESEKEKELFCFGISAGIHFIFNALSKSDSIEGMVNALGDLVVLEEEELIERTLLFMREGFNAMAKDRSHTSRCSKECEHTSEPTSEGG